MVNVIGNFFINILLLLLQQINKSVQCWYLFTLLLRDIKSACSCCCGVRKEMCLKEILNGQRQTSSLSGHSGHYPT